MIAILIVSTSIALGQNTIKGNIKDSNGNLLPRATITLKNKNSQSILNYAIANYNGAYSIDTKSDSLEVIISAAYLGYKSFSITIENKNQYLDLILTESPETLKEVLIKSYNIEKKEDTLSYSVSAFKSQNDRSVADVIKKMPGIEVLPNGQITYLGKPIEKYYIDGLDMLEGRYSLANENISAADVSKVQILENHQPIKVLDSLIFSDKTSLNIKLKNNTVLTGRAKIGGGLSPILFETNITPLIFQQKKQALISYQFNNTGDDLVRFSRDFSETNNLVNGFEAKKKNFLALRQISRPPFSSKRWLNNNEHFANINQLYRLKDKTDIKLGLSYLNSTRYDNGLRNTTYITENDTINLREQINNIIFLKSFKAKISIEKNLEKSYFQNSLSFKASWDRQRGYLENTNSSITQNLSKPYSILYNQFKFLKPFGKQLITIKSNTGYTHTHEELIVSPGQFQNLIANGEEFDSNEQITRLNSFFTENTIGTTKKIKSFTISPQIGLAFRRQELISDLFATSNGSTTNSGVDFQNNLELQNFTTFITNRLDFKKNRWVLSLETPLYLRYFANSSQIDNIRRLNFEPDLSVTKKLSPYWEANIRLKIEYVYGDIDNLYDGFILRNYLSLVRFNSVLSESKRSSSALYLNYRDAIKAIFGSLSLSLNNNNNNLFFNNSISENGALVIQAIERDNLFTTKALNLEISKYFNKAKTTLSFGGRFSFSERPQIVNGSFSSFDNLSQDYKLNAESKITKWWNISANSNLSINKLNTINNQSFRITNFKSSVVSFFNFKDNQSISFDAEVNQNNFQNNTVSNYLFNIDYQFTFKKYNLDAKIIWNNIFNTNNYVNANNGLFFSSENLYSLRPSQILLSVNFSL